jgi:hypothetical protein
MNQELALKVLGQIMAWSDERAREEFRWLRLMARLKYDGYRDFQAGMRFIESLATWLQQFAPPERETAYAFVRRTLVYIGPGEMQRLVEQFYPRTVRDRLIRTVATERSVPTYRVLADADALAAAERLRRQTLFMGLSDGARIDTIRYANSGLLNNEQLVQGIQVDAEKWQDLRDNLRKDLDDLGAGFRLVYLIDDFAGTGTTFLREDLEGGWKGKLVRFRESINAAAERLGSLFAPDWELCIHHYVASAQAARDIQRRLVEAREELAGKGWAKAMHSSFGTILPEDLPIDAVASRYDAFINLTRTYYDPQVETKHTGVGGVTHLGLGYGGCALPLVLDHNTPNNAIALLWAETDGGDRGGVSAPAMRPLFRRRQRHT